MIYKKDANFPYPILTNTSNSYDNCSFILDINLEENTNEYIFEIKQNPEVYQQGQCQHSLPGRPRKSAHDPGHAEIQHDGGNNDQQVAGVKVAVKPQGHAQQKRHRQRVPPEMVQPKVPYQTQGQKQQDENIGIKEQGSLSSLRKE